MRGRLLLLIAISGLFIFSSCTADKLDDKVLIATNLPIEGSQEVPARQTSGNGTMDMVYNKDTRTLSYTIRWNSLTGNATAAHIHGTAIRGVNAGILQDFGTAFPKTAAGTFSGTVLIDGVVFNEEDLLNGRYYVNIHTAMYSGGEIRGQIEGLK